MTAQAELKSTIYSREALPLVRTYSPADITPDGKFLEIALNGIVFPLELRDVGNEQQPVVIAWLDTHPDHVGVDPKIPPAAAYERAHLIKLLDEQDTRPITTIVTPYSHKSIPSIEQTVEIASDILHRDLSLVILPGDKDYAKAQEQSDIPVVAYQNVTSGGENKFLGITKDGIQILEATAAAGNRIIEIDDVFTTGGTDGAVQDVINQICGFPSDTKQPLIVVAREAAYGPGYPPATPNHVFPLINLPEFVGGVPKRA